MAVDGLEGEQAVRRINASCGEKLRSDGQSLNEIVVVVAEKRQMQAPGAIAKAQAQFRAAAAFGLQAGVGDGLVAAYEVGEAQVDVVVGGRSEALAVAGVGGKRLSQSVEGADLHRQVRILVVLGRWRTGIAAEIDGIGADVRLEAVESDSGGQSQGAVEQGDFILQEDRELGNLGGRGISGGEGEELPHQLPGGVEGGAVPNGDIAREIPVQAVDCMVVEPSGGEGLAKLHGQAVNPLLIAGVPPAALHGAAGAGAFLVRQLLGFRTLAVKSGLQ